MSKVTREKLDSIFQEAKRCLKGDYVAYENFVDMLGDLNLGPKDYQRAVRKLSTILRV